MKNKELIKLLIGHYYLYEGYWDDESFKYLVDETGLTKK